MCRFTADLAPRNPQDKSYPTLRRRPHPGGQVSLRVRRSETLGRDRFQVPRRRHDELHQAAGGVARRNDPHSRRRFVDPRAGPTGGPVRDRPQAARKVAGHAPAGLRQRSGADDHGRVALARALDARAGFRRQFLDQRTQARRPFLVRDRRQRQGQGLDSLPASGADARAVAEIAARRRKQESAADARRRGRRS